MADEKCKHGITSWARMPTGTLEKRCGECGMLLGTDTTFPLDRPSKKSKLGDSEHIVTVPAYLRSGGMLIGKDRQGCPHGFVPESGCAICQGSVRPLDGRQASSLSTWGTGGASTAPKGKVDPVGRLHRMGSEGPDIDARKTIEKIDGRWAGQPFRFHSKDFKCKFCGRVFARQVGLVPGVAQATVEETYCDAQECKERLKAQEELFCEFWGCYPKEVGEDKAKRAFDRLRPDKAVVAKMVTAIAWQGESEEWEKGAGEFIPQPATWLNRALWENEAWHRWSASLRKSAKWNRLLPKLGLDETDKQELRMELLRLLGEPLVQAEFSPDELRAMRAIAEGCTLRSMAEKYGWSKSTADNRLKSAIAKATFKRRELAQLVEKLSCVNMGLVFGDGPTDKEGNVDLSRDTDIEPDDDEDISDKSMD